MREKKLPLTGKHLQQIQNQSLTVCLGKEIKEGMGATAEERRRREGGEIGGDKKKKHCNLSSVTQDVKNAKKIQYSSKHCFICILEAKKL